MKAPTRRMFQIFGFAVMIVLLPAVMSAQWVWFGQALVGEWTGDNLGYSLALSPSGTRLAVGAPRHDGVGIESGLVRIYGYHGPTASWVQLGSDIEGEAADDESGNSVALSPDGRRVAIGAPYNDGNGTNAGHVRVYEYYRPPIDNWIRIGQDINGFGLNDYTGHSVALSSNGSLVAIGAPTHNGGDTDPNSGLAFVFLNVLFADGFESGNTSGWSNTLP